MSRFKLAALVLLSVASLMACGGEALPPLGTPETDGMRLTEAEAVGLAQAYLIEQGCLPNVDAGWWAVRDEATFSWSVNVTLNDTEYAWTVFERTGAVVPEPDSRVRC